MKPIIGSPLQRWRSFLAEPEVRWDLRISLLLALAAVALYSPGINWGLPQANAPGTTQSWGPDEIGPIGPIVELRNNLGGDNLGNPQYPMFHYLFIFLFYLPYLVFQYLTGGLPHPHGGYPFGFTDPASSVQMLMRISRLVSVLMGAGIVVCAYFLGRKLWDRATGVLAAVFVLLMYPMFYFARTSNLDVPVTFWQSCVLLLFALALQERRVSGGRWLAIGVLTAIALATKEQSYGILLLLVFPLLAWHFRAVGGGVWVRWRAPLTALAVSAFLYIFASGLAIRPEKYFRHLDYVRAGSPSGRFYQEYSFTPAGLLGMAQESFYHLADTLGWPVLLAALAGVVICAMRREERPRLWLLLPIPGLFFTVLALVGYVELRYLLPWGFLLALFASAYVVGPALRARPVAIRAAAWALVIATCGWSLLCGLDLHRLSWNDSRYAAAEWFADHVRPGDSVAHPGPERRIVLMPHFRTPFQRVPTAIPKAPFAATGPFETAFVYLQGKDDLTEFWHTPRWTYDALLNGSLGYDLVWEFQTPARFAPQQRHDSMQIFVNPRILVFARRERARELAAAPTGH
jgi:hypothetical protein